jgi:hypothetical protein
MKKTFIFALSVLVVILGACSLAIEAPKKQEKQNGTGVEQKT